MEQREKLIELVAKALDAPRFRNKSGCFPTLEENVADILIANGVVVLPCRCGGCEFERTCKAVNQYLGRDGYCCRARRKGGDE